MLRSDESAADCHGSGIELPVASGRGLPAWLLSIVLHGSVLVAFGLLAPASGSLPVGDAERVVGIALVVRDAVRSPQYLTGGDSAGEAGSSRAAAAGPVGIPGVDSLRQLVEQTGIGLPAAGEVAATSAASPGIPNAQAMARGTSGVGQRVTGGQTQTNVFGAQGIGSEFVYVFDRSSSMGGFDGRPLAAAKRELQRSLDDLTGINQFQIVFYNEAPTIFNPFHPHPPQMFVATEENRRLARQYVQGIRAAGGTHHRDALEFALRMGPDVIFFLTDADEPTLTANELADLRRRNRSATIIHTIEFGAGLFSGRENFLVQLARQHGGQHVYVNVAELPAER